MACKLEKQLLKGVSCTDNCFSELLQILRKLTFTNSDYGNIYYKFTADLRCEFKFLRIPQKIRSTFFKDHVRLKVLDLKL